MPPSLRRFRLAPIQISVGIAAIILLGIIAFKRGGSESLPYFDPWHRREIDLATQETDFLDMEFVRNVGVVDYKLGEFSYAQIAKMNTSELYAHYHSYLDNIDTLCSRKIRMGYIGYGGWEVCDDEGVRPDKHHCLVYSFTNNDEFSFEEDARRVYDCEVHNFNAEITGDDYNTSSNIEVHSYSIGRSSEITETGKEMYTFADIQKILHHEGRVLDVMKINTYGTEWPSLSAMAQFDELDNVKQLLVQYHLSVYSDDRLRRSIKVLKDLAKAGFRKFYATKNHRGAYHDRRFPVMRPRIYEVHYLNPRYLSNMGLDAKRANKN